MFISLYYEVICCVLKFILLVTSYKNKTQTCVNQKEYQLVHIPKKMSWTSFLHDYMQSFKQCHQDICFLCLLTLLALGWFYPEQLFLSYDQLWFVFSQFNNHSGKNSFLVVTAKAWVLLVWLNSCASFWDNHYGKEGRIWWLSRLQAGAQ